MRGTRLYATVSLTPWCAVKIELAFCLTMMHAHRVSHTCFEKTVQ
jgi:hypothetical protein